VIFGPMPLDHALGAVLAHTQRCGAQVLRKGQVLDAAAIATLRGHGREEVIAARLEHGDVGEDQAADRLAEALLSPLVGRTRAATGRVNLLAEAPGLLLVDAARIHRLNAVDEALTVGTLPDATPVAARDMLATVKVIPFAVPGHTLAIAEQLARQGMGAGSVGGTGMGGAGGAALRLAPFRPLRAGLVLTELPGIKASVLEGAVAATAARVRALTGTLLPPERCAHATGPIAAALGRLVGAGAELLLVAGASAVVDRRDVAPAGIVEAGGEILHFGMPVDPGNLLCVGRIGRLPALVLPGCARSPRLNGIDWVLWRIFAGLAVDGAWISRTGVGGLLKEAEGRPLPRSRATGSVAPAPDDAADPGSAADQGGAAHSDVPDAPASTLPRARPRVAVIVLAAGRSRRMAPRNKLLIAGHGGQAMVTRVVDQALGSVARPVLVVLGHQSAAVEQALAGRPVHLVHAPDYGDGLSASLRAGLAALPDDADAALVCLGDMPLVTARMLDRLIGAYDPDEGRTIVLPTFRGKQGNPMLWDRRWFAAMGAITGDVGARQLLAARAEHAVEVEIGEDAVLRDFDTPETLAGLDGN